MQEPHWITAATAVLDGVDLGHLTEVDPPVRSPALLRERGEREHVGAGLLEVVDHVGEGVQDAVELGMYRLGAGRG